MRSSIENILLLTVSVKCPIELQIADFLYAGVWFFDSDFVIHSRTHTYIYFIHAKKCFYFVHFDDVSFDLLKFHSWLEYFFPHSVKLLSCALLNQNGIYVCCCWIAVVMCLYWLWRKQQNMISVHLFYDGSTPSINTHFIFQVSALQKLTNKFPWWLIRLQFLLPHIRAYCYELLNWDCLNKALGSFGLHFHFSQKFHFISFSIKFW